MLAQRDLVPAGSAIAKALDYSRKRWTALTRYLEDGAVPIDNNAVDKLDKAVGSWTLELVVRRVASQWQTGSCDHELDRVST
jgi:hypothetical protein